VMSGQETLTPDAFAFDEDAADEDLVAGVSHAAHAASASTASAASAASATGEATAATEDSTRDQHANAQDEGTLQTTLDRAAAVRIKAALAAAGGNRVEAATTLGVDRTTLYRLMKRLSL